MFTCECCQARGPRGRASSCREVATTVRCTEAGSATGPAQPKVRSLHPDVKVSVARDRITKLEAAIAAVGEEDETAPKLKEALRKARQQAQILPIEVRVKSCEQFLERARKNVKAQEEVSQAQQLLMEAQSRHSERVAEVAEAKVRLITLQTEAASHVTIVKDPIQESNRPDWAAELDQLRQKVNELQIENRAPRILQTSSSGHLRPCGSARTSFEGRFCARLRRRHHEVDARSSSRHSRGNHGRQCSRGGKVVPCDGCAATSWSTVTMPPSMVSNAVR